MRDSRQPDVRLPALPPSKAAEGPTEISWHVHLSCPSLRVSLPTHELG